MDRIVVRITQKLSKGKAVVRVLELGFPHSIPSQTGGYILEWGGDINTSVLVTKYVKLSRDTMALELDPITDGLFRDINPGATFTIEDIDSDFYYERLYN